MLVTDGDDEKDDDCSIQGHLLVFSLTVGGNEAKFIDLLRDYLK